MDRRTFLTSAALGVGGSALIGATPLNPLIAATDGRDSGNAPETTTPTTRQTPTATPPPKHRLWTNDLYGEVSGLITDAAGRELYVSISNKVYRIGADTGEITWRAESEQSIETPVALGDRIVVAVGRHGRVLAIDRASGNRLWFESTDSFTPARPAVDGGTAVVPGRRVYGFDAGSGNRKWASETSFTAPNALQDGRFLYVGSAWNLAKFDLADGTPVWAWDDRERTHAPCYNFVLDPARGYIYGTYNWQVFAVDVSTGDVVWQGEYDNVVSSFHHHDDLLVSVSETDAGNTKLAAINLAEPAVAWKRIAPLDITSWEYGRITTALAGHDGQVVAGTNTGHLVALNPTSGDLEAVTRIFEDGIRRLYLHGDRAYATSDDAIRGIDLTKT